MSPAEEGAAGYSAAETVVPRHMPPSDHTMASPTVGEANALFDALEFLWVFGFVSLVFFSYLFDFGRLTASALLVPCLLPLARRLALGGLAALKTPFDIPVVLVLGGGVAGVVFSPTPDISRNAFMSLLALVAFYYYFATHPSPRRISLWVTILFMVLLLGVTVVSFAAEASYVAGLFNLGPGPADVLERMPTVPTPGGLVSFFTPNHGLATSLLIAASLAVCYALLGRHLRARIFSIVCSVAFIGLLAGLTHLAMSRLLAFTSVDNRMPLWTATVDMLKAHPLTGLGLGSWAPLYHGGTVAPGALGHPHNSYLEIYANFGILGVLGFLAIGVVAAGLAWRMLRSPRQNPWFGYAVGLIVASILVAVVGLVESAPIGIPVVGWEQYRYVVSPVPWLLLGFLVMAYRNTREKRPDSP